MKREKDITIGTRSKSLVLSAIAFVVGVLAVRHESPAQTVVYDIGQLRAELEDQNGDSDIVLADGDYNVGSSPLLVKRSVTLRAQNSRQATITTANVLQDDGFLISDFFQNEANPIVVVFQGLNFVWLDRAIHLLPHGNDSDNTLDLTVRDCGFDYLYYGIDGKRQGGTSNFTVTNFTVTECDFTRIHRRNAVENAEGKQSEQSAIWFRPRFTRVRIGGASGQANTFDDINYVAIWIGASEEGMEEWDDVIIEYNTITNVWNDNVGADECHGIFTFGTNHTIRWNTVENLWSPKTTGCEGIYSKAQTLLQIHDNTLTNAGGDEGMITVKTGQDGEFPGLTAETYVENNVLNRTKFTDETYNNGFVSFLAQFDIRHGGIVVKGNNATIQNNQLGDASGINGAMRIICGRKSPAVGENILIANNTLYTPASGLPDYVNPWYGIWAVVTGEGFYIEGNTIDGVEGASSTPPVGIRVEVVPCGVTSWTIGGSLTSQKNDIKRLTPFQGSVGIHVFGDGTLSGLTVSDVEADNIFDASVQTKVSDTSGSGCQ